MNDQEAGVLGGAALAMAIAKQPYPKVTATSIEKRIKSVSYLALPDSTVTICNITLENGFSVRGESACVDPRNFNLDIGKGLAYKDAFSKIWAFEGYLLAESRWQHSLGNDLSEKLLTGAPQAPA